MLSLTVCVIKDRLIG